GWIAWFAPVRGRSRAEIYARGCTRVTSPELPTTRSRKTARASRSARRRIRLLDQLREIVKLRHAEIGDDPVRVIRCRPVQQMIALPPGHVGAAHRPLLRRPEEHVDQVLTPSVDECRGRPPNQVVEPPADQGEPAPGEVIHGG